MTETHEKYARVDVPSGYVQVAQRRRECDKKGGGLMILANDDIHLELKECSSPDILHGEIKTGEILIKILLVYMDVKDQRRNEKIKHCLNTLLENVDDSENVIVLGDFNGHLGFIGEQSLDINGRYVLELMENYNLSLLNGDDSCTGVATREESGNRSTIDFVLVNKEMYSKFEEMIVDENKEYYDLSDHCLIKVNFKMKDIQRKDTETFQVQYYDVGESARHAFVQNFENSLCARHDTQSLQVLETMLKETADNTIKKCFTKRSDKYTKKVEPVWFNDEIKENIKQRKQYNKLSRKTDDLTMRSTYRELYKKQKYKVQELVKQSITKYETKITREIKNDKNNTKMWSNINKLRGKNNWNETVCLYDDNGNELNSNELVDIVAEFWRGIYQKHENNIHLVWNNVERIDYETQLDVSPVVRVDFDYGIPAPYREQYRFVRRIMQRINLEDEESNLLDGKRHSDHVRIMPCLAEHFDMVGRVSGLLDHISSMPKIKFTEEEVENCLLGLKTGKQPGTDGMKAEMYKWLGDSKISIKMFTKCFNYLIESREYPREWQVSKTVLIPKNNKPKYSEFRPIALTNTSYKILMSLLKNKLVQHLEKNNLINEYQAGFTKGRRLEDNVFLLKYSIKESKKMNKPLIVTAIDFKKAFDSIDRRKLIEMLIKYKCDANLIDIVSQLYTNDRTKLFLNNEEIEEINITSGIRQGCTGSPLMFTLVVNHVIDKIVKSKLGFRNESVYIPVLFFADDGLILSQSFGDTCRLIDIINEASNEIGLEINKSKSNIMIFGSRNKPDFIKNIRVVQKIKYLGVFINDCDNHFKTHKEEKIKMGRRMANLTHSVSVRSCNKLLIGKTYWKSVVLPSLLYASAVITWNKKELDTLQRIENNVWRVVLGAPGYTPIAALRGDVGCSNMVGRDRKNKLKYVKYILNGSSDLMKHVFNDMYNTGKDNLIRTIKNYMMELGIDNLNQLMELSDSALLNRINELDEREWLHELQEKSSLRLYANFKNQIHGETFYDNTFDASLMFRARSNVLKLNWRKRFLNESILCGLCGEEEETLEHFIMKCRCLQMIRVEFGMIHTELEKILLFSGDLDPSMCKRYLGKLWSKRKMLLDIATID